MSALAQLRQLTATQLRALNQFSKHVVRAAYEQGLTAAANQEWVRRLQYFPTVLAKDERPKEEAAAKPTLVEEKPPLEERPPPLYSMPHVFSSLAYSLEKDNDANKPEIVPEWKLKRANTVSRVYII